MEIFIFTIAILVFSVVIHEVSHGYVAGLLGDPTAKYEGRLTLNPIKHVDPVGSIVVPIVTSLLPGSLAFGWAKPVPYNPYNLRNRRWGELLVALAGPASNALIAVAFGLLIRFALSTGILPLPFIHIATYVVLINVTLAVFNLVPIAPLDGSKILFAFIPPRYGHLREAMERYGLVFFIVFVFALWGFVAPLIPWIFGLLTGIN